MDFEGIVEIAVTRFRPGDLLVVRSKHHLDEYTRKHIKEVWARIVDRLGLRDQVHCVVMEGGLTLDIIRKDDAA